MKLKEILWGAFIVYQVAMVFVGVFYHEELIALTNSFIANAGCSK